MSETPGFDAIDLDRLCSESDYADLADLDHIQIRAGTAVVWEWHKHGPGGRSEDADAAH